MRLYNLPGALGTLAFAFVALAQRPWEGDLPRAVTVECYEWGLKPLLMGDLQTCTNVPETLVSQYKENVTFREPLDNYLGTFCDANKTPECDENVLQSAMGTLEKGCGSHHLGSLVGIVRTVLHHYPKMKPALCSRNPVFCITESLEVVEEFLLRETKMDLYWLHLLLNQYESGLHEDFMRWFLNAFWSGKLCTACMSGFLKSAKEMGFLAPVVREENVYKEAKLRCGESFGGMCSTNFTSALTQGDGPYEGRKTPTTELAQATAPVGSATSGALLRTLPLSYVFASVLFGAWLSGSMDLM